MKAKCEMVLALHHQGMDKNTIAAVSKLFITGKSGAYRGVIDELMLKLRK
jgi:hypothetical protein